MSVRRNKKSILPNLIFSKIFLIFCFVLFLAILLGLAKGTIKNYQVKSEIEELKQEISRLEGQNQEFSQLINFLNSQAFIEQEAKLKMGYKKEGEHLVVIPNDQVKQGTESETAENELSNPQKWWFYFFNQK